MSKIQVNVHLNNEKTITHMVRRRVMDNGEEYDIVEIADDITIFLHPDQTKGLLSALKQFEEGEHNDIIVAVDIPVKEEPMPF